MRYFVRERMEWIGEIVRIFGFIGRRHICRKFWVSEQQASADLKMFQEMHPTLIRYDRGKKRYVAIAPPPDEEEDASAS